MNKDIMVFLKDELKSNEKTQNDLLERLDTFQYKTEGTLHNLIEQKVTYVKTNNLQYNHLFNNMNLFKDQIKSTNSSIDRIVTSMNTLYKSFNNTMRDNSQNAQPDMAASTVVNTKVIEDYEKLSQQVNSLESTTAQLTTTVDKLHVAENVKIAYRKLNQNTKEYDPTLNTQVLQLKAQVERLNKTVYGQNVPVTAIAGGECTKSRSDLSKFQKTIRKSFKRMIHQKTNNDLGTMVSKLKHSLNVKPQAQPYSYQLPDPNSIANIKNKIDNNNNNSSASSSSSSSSGGSSGEDTNSTITTNATSNATETSSKAIATLANAISMLESRIDEVYSHQTKMNDQMRDFSIKLDSLAAKSRKSPTTNTIRNSLNFGKPKKGSNTSEEEIEAVRKHLESLHREFNGAKGRFKDNILMIKDELAKMRNQQKTQEESAEHYNNELARLFAYAQENICALNGTTERQHASLNSVVSTLEQLEDVLTNEFEWLFPNKQQHGSDNEKQYSMKFIDKLCASLIYDRAILQRNCRRLKTLTNKLDSASDFNKVIEGIYNEQQQLENDIQLELAQVEEIKEECAAQTFGAALTLNEKKGHFLHQ
ncbi:hypothetical protein [Parasitella parasitica]|uniref:Uncharacterized protein n=1 Tax=Parasitella parasitica TaxID=35722 RepID=A0A0B7NPV8_9FUNG|nr:hypothetical protein [Parasitella parasitica]